MPAMRDVFWNRIYERAKEDRRIVILAADFAAPSLDKFRLELPGQFIDLGIAEQNMILMAAGMALEGKKPVCYAIAPFLTMRCFEQTRLYAAGMNLPITLVGVGAGIAYEDSGYTHHAVEDIALMRTLPHMRIFQPCDNATTRQMADMVLNSTSPVYVRLDRYGEDNLIGDARTIGSGLNIARPVQEITLLASGNMVMTALAAADNLAVKGIRVGVVDACIIPINNERFSEVFSGVRGIVTLEEHVLPGGLGGHILEIVSDLRLGIAVRRIGFDFADGFAKEYGGRRVVHAKYHLDVESVIQAVMALDGAPKK